MIEIDTSGFRNWSELVIRAFKGRPWKRWIADYVWYHEIPISDIHPGIFVGVLWISVYIHQPKDW